MFHTDKPETHIELSQASLAPTHRVTATDEQGQVRELHIPGELPLTIKVDGAEIVTLMTLGTEPELLTLGYLRNQHLFESLDDIVGIHVNWDLDTVGVTTRSGTGIRNLSAKLKGRTVTTGCAQGTVFSCTLDKLYEVRLRQPRLKQSMLYDLLGDISGCNAIYKQAGAVHGCAICHDAQVLTYMEDVGRHNAADAIAGYMWLQGIKGDELVFYTTGRLTSEIVMKVAHMGIPVLLSRSGITHMGLELAQDLGVTLIARAKARHFLVYHGAETIEFDARPALRKTTQPAVR